MLTAQFILAMKPAESFPFVLRKNGGIFFFKNFYMHNIDSPRDELKNIYCKDLVAVLKWIFLGLSLGLYFSFLFTLSLSLSPAPTIFTPDITL